MSTCIRTTFPRFLRIPSHSRRILAYSLRPARVAYATWSWLPEHTLPPSKLSVDNWRKIVDLWTERTGQLAENPDIAFVAAFENCGEAVGVTMPHPHGQIYAMPFIPPNVQKEISSAKEFANANGGECLFCRLLQEELSAGSRIIAADDRFAAFVPHAARFPAEVMLYPRRHTRTLLDLSAEEKSSLANLLSVIRRKYDSLYGFVMPLMMAVKQAPLRPSGGQKKELEPESPYHFHVQFMPLQRSPTKLKYLATMETGFGTFLAKRRLPRKWLRTCVNRNPLLLFSSVLVLVRAVTVLQKQLACSDEVGRRNVEEGSCQFAPHQ